MNQKLWFYAILLIIFLQVSFAATIHGTAYDLSLKKVNARVEINTVPKQVVIANNGSYSFDVPLGQYVLKAVEMQKNTVASIEENITLKREGSYVLDLILIPEIDELEDPNLDVSEIADEKNSYWLYAALGVAILAFLVLAIFLKRVLKREEKVEKELEIMEEKLDHTSLENLVELIKKEGGRATQKELRKHIPLSEAKISLMITELEHKGIVEKIKKGRGNIIILKK